MYLTGNLQKIKQLHLNKGKHHLNQKGVRILRDIFLREIGKILNRHETGSFAGFKDCMSEKSLRSTDEIVDSKSILKSFQGDDKHSIIFAHLNINSLKNKFDLNA